ISKRDVWDPPITYPTTGTIWDVGSTYTVTWDTSDPPSQVTNYNGELLLGYLEDGSENLMVGDPLAQNFNLTDGSVDITVPDVATRDDYIVVLLGDSGNASPEFTI
ncbi:hypothetical protein FISHEDRAFT_5943, partial [Fistulina hepatica ATCC 64428]